MLPTPTMLSVFYDDAHLVVLFRVGVKQGVISGPADLVLTPGMSHEITPSWIFFFKKSKDRNYGQSFENK